MNNKKNIIIIGSTISITIILSIVLLISLINHKTTSKENAYGNFENAVIFSDKLDYILSEDFDKYTIDIIEKGLNEFFIPLYPQGVGIEFISYNATDKGYSIRIVDSYGKFHTLTIQYNPDDMSTTIIIDDSFKNDYLPNIPNRDEDE